MWAAGNGGRNGDSCAADGYASSMYTIAIGSADESGQQASYDESCAAKMAVTFSFNTASYKKNRNYGQVVRLVYYNLLCKSYACMPALCKYVLMPRLLLM